jgi:ribosomal protein S18 acetylase RimI-like enzyme
MNEATLCLSTMSEEHLAACGQIVEQLELFKIYQYGGAAAQRHLRQALLEERADLLVVLQGATVAGFVWFVPRGAFDRSGYLRLIAVDKRFTGQGVGQLLLDELERKHLAQGGIVLLAAASNTGAHRFYERRGYQQVGLLPDYTKPSLHERIYYKAPTPPHPSCGTLTGPRA